MVPARKSRLSAFSTMTGPELHAIPRWGRRISLQWLRSRRQRIPVRGAFPSARSPKPKQKLPRLPERNPASDHLRSSAQSSPPTTTATMMNAFSSRSGAISRRAKQRPSASIVRGTGKLDCGNRSARSGAYQACSVQPAAGVTANVVAVCEGEKDADNVAQCGLWSERTTLSACYHMQLDGAWKPGEKPKWLPRYNPYFAGKFVIVFPTTTRTARPGRRLSLRTYTPTRTRSSRSPSRTAG